MRRLSAIAVGMTMLVVLAACGSGDGDAEQAVSTTSTTTEASTTTTEAAPTTTAPTTTVATTTSTTLPPLRSWAREDLDAVGRVVQNGSVALTVARSDSGLEMIAVDVETGDDLWSAPYSMGGRFPGMGLGGFDISGDTMAHMEGDLADPISTEMVGRDLKTGEELWRIAAPYGFGAEGCGEVYCTAWVNPNRGRYVVAGVDPQTGEETWSIDGGDIDYVTDPDLAIVLEPGDEPLIHAVEPVSGNVRWTVDPQELFDREMSTNYGWNFRRENGVILATLNRPFQDTFTYATTFGLDENSGELLWQLDDHRMTRWRIDPYAISPYSDGEEWFRHDSLATLDPTTGFANTYADLPASDDVANGVIFARGVAYGSDGQTVFWEQDETWVGYDVVSGTEAPTPDVLWVSELESEDLADLMPGEDRTSWLRGVRYASVSSQDGATVEVTTEEMPSFVGPTAESWTVWIDADGKLSAFETR